MYQVRTDEKKNFFFLTAFTQLEPLGFFFRFLTTTQLQSTFKGRQVSFVRSARYHSFSIYREVSPRPYYRHLALGKGDDSVCKPSLKLSLVGVGPQAFEGHHTSYDVSFPDPYSATDDALIISPDGHRNTGVWSPLTWLER
jgi:hypothetical protein